MRKALNDNPVVQIVMVAVLLIVVAFLFATRVLKRDEEADTAPATSSATAADTATAPPLADGSTIPAPTVPGSPAQAPSAAVSAFEAGPGLPQAVVGAYEDGDTIVLLITRRVGIEDRELRSLVRKARSRGDVSVFVTNAGKIARFSRITQGVDVNRVPALIVMKPRRATEGGTPEASVSYGYRSTESILQAIRDAGYRGRADLPAYPE